MSATQNMPTPSLNIVVEKKEEDERTEEEKLIDWMRQIQKKEEEAIAMLERTNIQERMNEEGPFELSSVTEVELEKSEGEMATSAHPSTVIEKKEEDERTEEEKTIEWIRQIQEKEAEAAANEEDVKILERIKRMNEEGPFELPINSEAEATANEEDVKILERIKRMNEEGPFALPINSEAEFEWLFQQERTEWPATKSFAEGEKR